MLAALPYCDALVSGHSFQALAEVAEAIGADVWDAPDRAPSAAPERGRALAERDAHRGQLGGDAERSRPEQRQRHPGLGDGVSDGAEALHLPGVRSPRRARRTSSAARSRPSATSTSTTR